MNKIIKENWFYRIDFDYEFFLNFIKRNKVNHLFLWKLKFKNHKDFNFKLLNLNELDTEEELEDFFYLNKFAFDVDFIRNEKMIYLWNDINRKKWFLFFPFSITKEGHITNEFINIITWNSKRKNEKIKDYYKVFDIYWVSWISIWIEL